MAAADLADETPCCRPRWRVSIAAGWAWTAGALAAVVTARAAWPLDRSRPPDHPACRAPVELVPTDAAARLACAWQPSPCRAAVAAGDRLVALAGEDCPRRVAGGMRASWRLLADVGLDLNQASIADLQAIAGIGPALAERIAKDRDARGAFRAVAELRRVRGVGPVLFARVSPQLYVTPPLARTAAD